MDRSFVAFVVPVVTVAVVIVVEFPCCERFLCFGKDVDVDDDEEEEEGGGGVLGAATAIVEEEEEEEAFAASEGEAIFKSAK